jgi:hypothetical protein
MHILLGLLIAVLVAYFVYLVFFAPQQQPQPLAQAPRSDRALAFLSNGLIFFRERGGELRQLHSLYAQEAADRRERSRQRHSWKEGTTFNIAAGGGRRSFDAADKPLLATAAAYAGNGDLLYFLKDESMGGLFRREAASGKELRLVLKQGLHLADLNPSPDGTQLAATSHQSAGVANIALMNPDGSGYRELTGGDTVDASPAWIPGAPKRLLFQSSGLARNAEGYILALGNASLQKLDLETGSLAPILEDPAYDYLRPRVAPSGELLYIRRPYAAQRYGAGAMLSDALLFPFRLLRAVFHYLNFFSLMYSRKPLTSADSPATQADIKSILLQGKRVDAEKTLRNARAVQGVPSLVPDDWQLLARSPDGQERLLATNVASYDLCPDGTLVYSNGRGVFVLEADGSARLALADQLVGDVVAAG